MPSPKAYTLSTRRTHSPMQVMPWAVTEQRGTICPKAQDESSLGKEAILSEPPGPDVYSCGCVGPSFLICLWPSFFVKEYIIFGKTHNAHTHTHTHTMPATLRWSIQLSSLTFASGCTKLHRPWTLLVSFVMTGWFRRTLLLAVLRFAFELQCVFCVAD